MKTVFLSYSQLVRENLIIPFFNFYVHQNLFIFIQKNIPLMSPALTQLLLSLSLCFFLSFMHGRRFESILNRACLFLSTFQFFSLCFPFFIIVNKYLKFDKISVSLNQLLNPPSCLCWSSKNNKTLKWCRKGLDTAKSAESCFPPVFMSTSLTWGRAVDLVWAVRAVEHLVAEGGAGDAGAVQAPALIGSTFTSWGTNS